MSSQGSVVRSVLLPWLCLTLAGAFLLLAVTAGPAEITSPALALAQYGAGFGPAAAGAALLCGGLLAARAERWLPRLATGSVLVYGAVLGPFGLTFAPWVAVGVAVVATVLTRSTRPLSSAVLTLHVIGTLAALHLAATLTRYASGWPPFKDVLRALL